MAEKTTLTILFCNTGNYKHLLTGLFIGNANDTEFIGRNKTE